MNVNENGECNEKGGVLDSFLIQIWLTRKELNLQQHAA